MHYPRHIVCSASLRCIPTRYRAPSSMTTLCQTLARHIRAMRSCAHEHAHPPTHRASPSSSIDERRCVVWSPYHMLHMHIHLHLWYTRTHRLATFARDCTHIQTYLRILRVSLSRTDDVAWQLHPCTRPRSVCSAVNDCELDIAGSQPRSHISPSSVVDASHIIALHAPLSVAH